MKNTPPPKTVTEINRAKFFEMFNAADAFCKSPDRGDDRDGKKLQAWAEKEYGEKRWGLFKHLLAEFRESPRSLEGFLRARLLDNGKVDNLYMRGGLKR